MNTVLRALSITKKIFFVLLITRLTINHHIMEVCLNISLFVCLLTYIVMIILNHVGMQRKGVQENMPIGWNIFELIGFIIMVIALAGKA